MRSISRSLVQGLLALAVTAGSGAVSAALMNAYVTGEDGADKVIFKITYDTTTAMSGTVAIAVTDGAGDELDGISFLEGSTNEVVVGSPDGRIARFDVTTGATLTDFVSDTNLVTSPPASGTSRPSSVLAAPTHIYYVENQFGNGGSTHRIMRTPIAGGAQEVVFDGSVPATALENFEGLEYVDGRLYFFGRDPAVPADRALFSIALDGTSGLWDSSAVSKEIAGLKGSGATTGGADGSDELTFDPTTGFLFGTNIVNGEVVYWDPTGATGGLLITEADILGGTAGGLADLSRSLDGIRADGEGNLIFSGRGGVFGGINIAGAFAGADDSDITIFYDSVISGTGYVFDDLAQVHDAAITLPGVLALMGWGLMGWAKRG